nr:hypothetical protein [Kofleriaceae bacterium]
MARDDSPDAWRAAAGGLAAYRLAFAAGIVLVVGVLVQVMVSGNRVSWGVEVAALLVDIAKSLAELGGAVWLAARTPRGAVAATLAAIAYGVVAACGLIGLVCKVVAADSWSALVASTASSVAGVVCVALACAAVGRALGNADIVRRGHHFVASVAVLGVGLAILYQLADDTGVVVVMFLLGLYALVQVAAYIMLLGFTIDAMRAHAPLPPRAEIAR